MRNKQFQLEISSSICLPSDSGRMNATVKQTEKNTTFSIESGVFSFRSIIKDGVAGNYENNTITFSRGRCFLHKDPLTAIAGAFNLDRTPCTFSRGAGILNRVAFVLYIAQCNAVYTVGFFIGEPQLIELRQLLIGLRVLLVGRRTPLKDLQVLLRGFQIMLGRFQVLLNEFQVPLRRFQVLPKGLQVPLRRFQVLLNEFQVPLRRFQVLLNEFQVPLRRFQVLLNEFQVSLRRFQVLLNEFQVPLNGFQVLLNEFQVPLRHFRALLIDFRGLLIPSEPPFVINEHQYCTITSVIPFYQLKKSTVNKNYFKFNL